MEETGLAICCVLLFVLPVYLFVTAATLQGGCALYNRFVGKRSPERVPSPTLGRAMGAQFLCLMAGLIAGGLAAAVLHAVGQARNLDPDSRELLVALQLFPLGVVVFGAVLAHSLPTRFARGVLVALCHVLVWCLIALAVGLTIGALALLGFLISR